jgi:hypothetical protein
MHFRFSITLLLFGCLSCSTASLAEPGARAPMRGGQRTVAQDPEAIMAAVRRGAPVLRGGATPARVAFGVGVGAGSVRANLGSSRLDDRTEAGLLRLQLETSPAVAHGAGLHVGILHSRDDLFAGVRFNDGLAPAAADSAMQGMSLFPHGRWLLHDDGDLAVHLRGGVHAEWLRLAHDPASVQREWWSAGPRLVIEPVWRAMQDRDRAVECFGRIGGELAWAGFEERFRGGEDDDQTWRWAATAGVGLRYRHGGLQSELGYEFGHAAFAGTDTALLGRDQEASFTQHWLLWSLTLRF